MCGEWFFLRVGFVFDFTRPALPSFMQGFSSVPPACKRAALDELSLVSIPLANAPPDSSAPKQPSLPTRSVLPDGSGTAKGEDSCLCRRKDEVSKSKTLANLILPPTRFCERRRREEEMGQVTIENTHSLIPQRLPTCQALQYNLVCAKQCLPTLQ